MATCRNSVRDPFPAPRPQDGALDFKIEPAFLAVVYHNEDSSRESSPEASFNTAVRKSDALNRRFVTGDVAKIQPHLLLVHVQTVGAGQTTALI